MFPDLNPDQITNLDKARQVIKVVLNPVEQLRQENDTLRAEVQHLRDEVNRLKGEQGQPTFKTSTPNQAVTTRRSGNGSGGGAKAARSTKSKSSGKKSYGSNVVSCRRMPNSKAMKRWWCKISS